LRQHQVKVHRVGYFLGYVQRRNRPLLSSPRPETQSAPEGAIRRGAWATTSSRPWQRLGL